MVRLIDLLRALRIELSAFKIHLATDSGDSQDPCGSNPLNAFYHGQFKEWQESQTKKNFSRPHILSLIAVQREIWLFAGVYRVLGVGAGDDRAKYLYHTKLEPGQKELIGSIFVQFKRPGRQSYLNGENYANQITLEYTDYDIDMASSRKEGALFYRLHLVRERDQTLVMKKKKIALLNNSSLSCEVCGFSFIRKYGRRGHDFCEVHHVEPLAVRACSSLTKLNDLAIVCSNCHRMLHREPYIRPSELRNQLKK